MIFLIDKYLSLWFSDQFFCSKCLDVSGIPSSIQVCGIFYFYYYFFSSGNLAIIDSKLGSLSLSLFSEYVMILESKLQNLFE